MITKMSISLSPETMQEALYAIFHDGFDFTLNEPSGDFFYDPWRLKPKYQGTIWQTIIETLPYHVGEAKIRKLNSGEAYISHADIDDRYHLNISGECCYLINLDTEKMYPTLSDGYWYNMDAGSRHTAANFGNRVRFQLVVRQLLISNNLINPIDITIISTIEDQAESRFIFDDKISTWLNSANKHGIIDKFSFDQREIKFKLEQKYLQELKSILPPEFKIL